MKTKVLLLMGFAFSSLNSKAQTINDSIFENVIHIKDENVTMVGMNYLVDISIPKSVETPVIFTASQIPINLLAKIYPEFPRIIVIVPNRIYSSCVASKNEISQKPIKSTIVYEFIRTDRTIKKDSLILKKEYPIINSSATETLKSNEVESYYTERFGSICCPRDLQWDNSPTRDEFISHFEKENNVEIIDTYRKIIGKEGEVIYYYTLSGLSNELRLHFILDRNYNRIINRHLKDIIFVPQIFTPTRVEMDGIMIKM